MLVFNQICLLVIQWWLQTLSRYRTELMVARSRLQKNLPNSRKLWTDVYPLRIAPILMILPDSESSWRDLSFETDFVFKLFLFVRPFMVVAGGCRFSCGLGLGLSLGLGIGIGFVFSSSWGHAPPSTRWEKTKPMPRPRLRPRPQENFWFREIFPLRAYIFPQKGLGP